jgi:hypothetical protein
MSTSARERWKVLENWYREQARPVLEEYDPQRVPVLDGASVRLEKMANALESELKVCILGKAGVGKSTLLNSLLDPKLAILPQGGIGPLTAQAIVVHHANSPYFEVTYHGRSRLNRLLFAIQQHAILQFGGVDKMALKSVEEELDEEDAAALKFEAREDERTDHAGPKASPKADGYLQQGRLIIQNDQFSKVEDARYIIDGLRACLDLPAIYASNFSTDDQERIELVRSILPQKSRKKSAMLPTQRKYTKESPSFLRDLKRHAAGSLAPLVADLKVGWPAEILAAGARLVDLPGVGIANDEYRKVTQHHVREARAIGIVVDRAGIDEASAELLRDTGFLNALLLDRGDEVAEAVHLFVAVVKLDLTADDMVNEALNDGTEIDWVKCFEDSRLRSIDMVKGQLKRELSKIADDSGESTRSDMHAVVSRLLDSVEVHPIAAMEYRKLNMSTGARIHSPGQSYVPQLAAAIQNAARERRARLEGAYDVAFEGFEQSLRSALAVLGERARSEERAEAEVRELREDFATFSGPLGRELVSRKGAFRSFLRETVPARIDSGVREATDEVRKEIQRHLRRYRDYPWQTLRATIRHGGAFVGARRVDLPSELTLKFEEPVALLWSKTILTLIRQRTRELGDDNVRIANAVVEWARSQGGRVPPRVAEILEQDLRTDTKQLASIGKDAIEELKERVKHALSESIEARVRKSCQTFVDSEQDRGKGVKDRMHSFFEGVLADAIVEAARPVAMKVLTNNYVEVQSEVLAALKSLVDPVERASELVIEREANAILKKDQKQRDRLLAALETLNLPTAA